MRSCLNRLEIQTNVGGQECAGVGGRYASRGENALLLPGETNAGSLYW